MAEAEGSGPAARTAAAAHPREGFPLGRLAGPAAILAGLLLLLVPGCVYFNTYYNAQKYFRRAEKARLEAEREAATVGASSADAGRATRSRATAGSRSTRSRTRRSGESYHSLYEKAVRKASIVLEKHPESELVDDAMFIAGRALYWQSDYFYAARSFRDLEVHFPESEYYNRARYWRGLSLEGQGVDSEARTVFRALFEEGHPKLGARAGFRLGEMAHAEEEYRVAIEEYRAVLSRYPESEVWAETLLRLGEAHLALEEAAHRDSALVAFTAVARAHPDDKTSYRARLSRGKVLYEQGEAEAALEVYTGLLRGSRFRSYEGETRLLLAQYYWDRGMLDEALAEYERVRDDFPQTAESAMALYQTGLLHLREYGERERGQEYLEEVPKENRTSEASRLAQQMLGTLNEADRLRQLIARADSLTAAERAADSTAAALESAVAVEPAATAGDTALAAAAATVAADGAGDGVLAAGDTVAAAAPAATGEAAEADTGAAPAAGDAVETVVEAEPPPRRASRPAPERQRRSRRGKKDPRTGLLDNLFSVAELYRDRLVLPDSAAYFYGEIIDRFPDTPELPRALYSLAWIRLDMQGDAPGSQPFLQRLVDEYPETIHAQGARELLGMAMAQTAERQAADEFARLEATRGDGGGAARRFVDGLDSLVVAYPETPTAARAAYLAAWTWENALGDSAEASRRLDAVAERFPSSEFANLVRQRRQAQTQGVVAKLERSLKAMGEGVKPGERLVVLAVEPDSADADSIALGRKLLGFALRAHRAGQLELAEELYEAVLDQRPKEARALYGLGDVRWRDGYYEDAVDYLRQSLGISRRPASQPLGALYHLFAYHVRAGQVDSSNYYLREVARRDRESPRTASLQDEFPQAFGPEPEELEISLLEEIELEVPERLLEASAGGQGLGESPLVRTSVRPRYPAEAAGDSAVVTVDVLISEDGFADSIEVFAGEEPFAAAAAEAARDYVFYAGEDGRGRPLRVWVEVHIPVAPLPAAPAGSAPEPPSRPPPEPPPGAPPAGAPVEPSEAAVETATNTAAGEAAGPGVEEEP